MPSDGPESFTEERPEARAAFVSDTELGMVQPPAVSRSKRRFQNTDPSSFIIPVIK